MGMDVFGNSPTKPVGEYFRNNVWWWRPLVAYIVERAPQEIVSKCEYWQSKDGDGLNARDAMKLAFWLHEQVATGDANRYEEAYTARLASLPQHRCNYCHGTGVRRDEVGAEHGMLDRAITEEGHPRKGQVGWCNGCEGRGMVEHSDTNYPFSVKNVQEFAAFLEACGGFGICQR